MKNQFVPYELAVKLKELGFDEPCIAGYRDYNGIRLMSKVSNNSYPIIENLGFTKYCHQNRHIVQAPLWQQAFDFILSKINLEISYYSHYVVGFDREFYLDKLTWTDYEGYYLEGLCHGNTETLEQLIKLIEEENKI